ncbi:MAG: hypothetical protein KBA46_01210 [Candidatus Omnitrophica bacterium]|nr:hypothetical protein [Candidatus Omnitrophota bacterium]
MKRIRSGQSTVEFAVVICVLIAALLTMGVYFRRSVQGKLKLHTDEISGESVGYAPEETLGDTLITKNSLEVTNSYTMGNRYDFNFLNNAVTKSISTVVVEEQKTQQERVLPYH